MATDQAIEFREIEGFPGYRIGSDGSVWSRRKPCRYGAGRLHKEWRQLKTHPAGTGRYLTTHLRRDGRTFTMTVHRLVLRTFAGECPPGMEALHEDGDPANSRLNNLRWGTPADNSADSRRHGTMALGERNGHAKLTAEAVTSIRAKFAARQVSKRAMAEALAKEHGVSAGCIDSVVRRCNWKHII